MQPDHRQSALLAELQAQLPLQIVAAKWGFGSFITLDLANNGSDTALHIWVYLCDWLIYQDDRKLYASATGAKDTPIPCFEGRTLTNIELDSEDRAIDLFFDQELSLLLSPNLTAFAPEDDLVMFFRPNKRVVAFSCEKGFYEAD